MRQVAWGVHAVGIAGCPLGEGWLAIVSVVVIVSAAENGPSKVGTPRVSTQSLFQTSLPANPEEVFWGILYGFTPLLRFRCESLE